MIDSGKDEAVAESMERKPSPGWVLASLALCVIHWPRAFGWDQPTPPGPDSLDNDALGTLPKKRSEARLEGRQAPWRSPRASS